MGPFKYPRPPSLQAAATVRHWASLARETQPFSPCLTEKKTVGMDDANG